MSRRAVEEALLGALAIVGAAHLGSMFGTWLGRKLRRRYVVITVPTVLIEGQGESIEVPGFLQPQDGQA